MDRFNCFNVSPTLARKLGSEFVGTFIMVFTSTAAAILNQQYYGSQAPIANAASSGLAVMAVILSTGHISGAHINPAVTIAFAALRHFPWLHVLPYIVVQLLGSTFASFVLKAVFHSSSLSGGCTVPTVSHSLAFGIEFIITFILMFIITAVATDTRALGELAAIAVGGTVMLNAMVAGTTTGASMNPVRSLGPAVVIGNYDGLWIYLVAPPLGALVGAAVYTSVKIPDKPTNQVRDEFNGEDASSANYEPPPH